MDRGYPIKAILFDFKMRYYGRGMEKEGIKDVAQIKKPRIAPGLRVECLFKYAYALVTFAA